MVSPISVSTKPFALISLVLSLLTTVTALADDDDEPPARAVSGDASTNGASAPASLGPQQIGGVVVTALQPIQLNPERQAYAKVLDLQSLFELRGRYRQARAELTVAQAALRVAVENRSRTAHLQREAIVANRMLIQAEAQESMEQARVDAASNRLREIREQALQQFSEVLFRQTIESESALFQQLLSRRQVLLLVSLGHGDSLPNDLRTIRVGVPGRAHGDLRTAELLSPAPRTDEAVQGEAWFATTDAAGFRSGMRLDCRVPSTGSGRHGVVVPRSAVVWFQGQAWIYVREANGRFERRPLGEHAAVAGGWFVGEGLEPGTEVVTTGAQMLLSEEQRGSPPAGDDD